ncbi:succinate semialdehyde dehydrogenase NADP+ linked [Varicellaria rhodocarpa]|nr:succinate semialdehyde dehydrogenase NADP+ linked [Varicellaria rhodocarpa]
MKFFLSTSTIAIRYQFRPINLPKIISRTYAMPNNNIPKLKDPSLFKQECYVNGEWVKATSGKTFDVTDPSTGKIIGSCPEFSKEEVDNAIKIAAEAWTSFRKTTGRERSRMLRKWYDLMTENFEDLATLITWENGKPINDAKGEVTYAANFFEWFSEEAPRNYGDVIPSSVPANRVFTIKEPVGVCGLITPWNFPAAMLTRKLGPALAAGCTVVAKSPGETPFTSLAIAELAHRAGIPKGVVNFVTALQNTVEVGAALTSNPTVRKVSFTGSTGVGKLLMKQSADTLKKLSFELGGNAPFIVFEDADLDAAVAGAIACKFRSSGQTCVCANRLYIQKGIYDSFATRFAEKVRNFKVGGGFDEGVTHGPVIHDRAVTKVAAHVKDAEKKGGKVTVGGKKMPILGTSFFEPTVITQMTMDMQLATEETFGPVAGLFPFETEQEVIEMANSAEVGLAGYFFSKDIQRVYRVAEALEVGMVGVNTGLISDPAAPFGGVKESGFGREGSKYAFVPLPLLSFFLATTTITKTTGTTTSTAQRNDAVAAANHAYNAEVAAPEVALAAETAELTANKERIQALWELDDERETVERLRKERNLAHEDLRAAWEELDAMVEEMQDYVDQVTAHRHLYVCRQKKAAKAAAKTKKAGTVTGTGGGNGGVRKARGKVVAQITAAEKRVGAKY